ncbi:hypothetical protein MC885_009612 [Smutsia gigantea]|nr:hypothetical protein MC885_009612 [Smutsia gigantea]
MADLEAVLADVSYLMAMEKSKATPAARASKKIVLPEPSIRSVMQKYLEERNEITFDKIFNQKIGLQAAWGLPTLKDRVVGSQEEEALSGPASEVLGLPPCCCPVCDHREKSEQCSVVQVETSIEKIFGFL